MSVTILKCYQNGEYTIHDVPHTMQPNGNTFLQSEVLLVLAEKLTQMERLGIKECSYKDFLSEEFRSEKDEYKNKTYRAVAHFELKNYLYYMAQINSKCVSVEEVQHAKKKLALLEAQIQQLDMRLQELVRRRYLTHSEEKITDKEAMQSLKISRTQYYHLKTEALVRIGKGITKGEFAWV